MKLLIRSIIGLYVMVGLFLIYQNYQSGPEIEDVERYLRNHEVEGEVHGLLQFGDRWVTYYEDEPHSKVALLDRNWFGDWTFSREMQFLGYLGSLYPRSDIEAEGIWTGSIVIQMNETDSYLFMMVENPDLQKVEVSLDQEEFETVDLKTSNGKRFYFLKKDSEIHDIRYRFTVDNDIFTAED
ncbi:hypothetical protein LCM20_01835 [Halobacillus litoralis]|uniref:hypothetical protein n=1 Tax=Halobacillus litoralis TaxID=45668 RepID=UPI001CD2D69F|nr:hypothetical protein [Halobacillus litoralis]MCA0969328.1 hypothetical protein [Halobacillus litoralis]